MRGANASSIRRRSLAWIGAATLGLIPPLPIIGQPPGQHPSPGHHKPAGSGDSHGGGDHHRHHHRNRRPHIRAATTGPHSELIRTLPISPRPNARPKVAMSLRPAKLHPLQTGQRLVLSAEVQVSTTCVDRAPRCVGTRYGYNPAVGARLVLARGPRAAGSKHTVPLSRRRSLRCGQRRPNRNHHCTLVIDDTALRVGRASSLPCRPDRCFVNLVLDAHNPRARHGNVLAVGGDQPSGRVKQNKGRINALVLGRSVPASSRLRKETRKLRVQSLPARGDGSSPKRVVYSVRFDNLRRGDVLTASGRAVTDIDKLSYNTFIGSDLILTSSPSAVHRSRLARSVATDHGRLGAINGFNCTHGDSAFESPCWTNKVGVARIVRDRGGRHSAPLYVNLVARIKPVLAKAHSAGRAREMPKGHLTVTRWRP